MRTTLSSPAFLLLSSFVSMDDFDSDATSDDAGMRDFVINTVGQLNDLCPDYYTYSI